MAEELERKYLGASRELLRPLLERIGAVPAEAPHFESNTLYDRESNSLRSGHRLLRLRTREWADHTDTRLTFKSPLPEILVAGRPVKRREEIELGVEDAGRMEAILEHLGFHPAGYYEKVRESWKLGEAHVDMDELPFLHAVEIEAPAPLLEKLEVQLGLDKFPVSANSYHILYLDWLQSQGLPPDNSFRFAREQRERIRALLGLDA